MNLNIPIGSFLSKEEQRNIRATRKALKILVKSFEHLCRLLYIKVPLQTVNSDDVYLEEVVSTETESEPTDDDLDYVDWFFEGEQEVQETQKVSIVNKAPVSSPSSSSSSSFCHGPYEVNESLARGLQHSVYSDYNDQGDSYSNDEISLPMRLAWATLSSPSSSTSSLESAAKANHDRMIKFGINSLCIKRTYNLNQVISGIGLCMEIYRTEWERIVFHYNCDTPILQTGVVVLGGTVESSLCEVGHGISHDHYLHTKILYSSTNALELDNLTIKTRKYGIIVDKLLSLEVHVLFVARDGASDLFRDLCYAAGIIVITIPSTLLAPVTVLSNCRIVHDLMYIDNSHIGGVDNPLSLEKRVKEPFDGSIGEGIIEILLSTSSTNMTHEQFVFTQSHLPIHINIAGKCKASRASVEDRFKRCYFRLRAVVKDGGVCVGGGLPELLTAMELKSIVNKYQMKSVYSNSDLALMPLLQHITDALLLYPVLVNTTNGMSWSQANLRNDSVMQTVNDIIKNFHEVKHPQCDSSVVEFLKQWHLHENVGTIESADINIVHNFPVPICVQNEDNRDNKISENPSNSPESIDCISIKVESLKSAVSFTASVLRV